MYIYHIFLIHSFADGHLGFFHVLAIINNAVMSIGVHVFLSDLVSSVCMPRSGIAGSYGSSVLVGRSFTSGPPEKLHIQNILFYFILILFYLFFYLWWILSYIEMKQP